MDIASMLNGPSRSNRHDQGREQLTPPTVLHGRFDTASSTLPTPSPEFMPSRRSSESRECKARTPWDAGGYSLPLLPGPKYSSSGYAYRSPTENLDSASHYNFPSRTDRHSRHGSMEASFGGPRQGLAAPLTATRPDRSMAPTAEFQQDISRDRSFNYGEGRHQRGSSRSSFWPEQGFESETEPSVPVHHKLSDSHSSLSSYASSTFSGGHSRISSLSTVSGIHPTIDFKIDQESFASFMPRSASFRPLSPQPQSLSHQTISEGLSETAFNMKGARRRRSRLSEDQNIPYMRPSTVNSSIKKHKRAISAPNPARRAASSISRQIGISEASLTPPPTENSESRTLLRQRILEYGSEYNFQLGQALRDGKVCQFVQNCDTNSSPRKVISHIFGRNKVCTRRIPERVWVCMCRKHYQRIRYRKGPQYSITQVNLVYEQICRMVFWSLGCEVDSDVNVEGIKIQSWAFSIRKRELNRPSEQSNIPRWIIERLGTGKTHGEILDIVQRLRVEVENKVLLELPPVEFLPEVVDALETTGVSQSLQPLQPETPEDVEMSEGDEEDELTLPAPADLAARFSHRRPQATWELPQSHHSRPDYGQSSPLPTIDEPVTAPARFGMNGGYSQRPYSPYYDNQPVDGRAASMYRGYDETRERQRAHPSNPISPENQVNPADQIFDTSAHDDVTRSQEFSRLGLPNDFASPRMYTNTLPALRPATFYRPIQSNALEDDSPQTYAYPRIAAQIESVERPIGQRLAPSFNPGRDGQTRGPGIWGHSNTYSLPPIRSLASLPLDLARHDSQINEHGYESHIGREASVNPPSPSGLTSGNAALHEATGEAPAQFRSSGF